MTDRNKLLELAKQAGFCINETDFKASRADIETLERFAALLSQQEQEPAVVVIDQDDRGYVSNDQISACLPVGTKLYLATPPAQGWNEATTSDETILSHMSKYWEHQWHDGDQHQIRIGREQLVAGIRALARPSQAQEPQQFAPCYVCGRPMDGLSEDDCHCFHRRELAQSVSGAVDEQTEMRAAYKVEFGVDMPDDSQRAVTWSLAWNAALSRAQAAQLAQQAPAVSDELLSLLKSGDLEPILFGAKEEEMRLTLYRARQSLLSQPAAAPELTGYEYLKDVLPLMVEQFWLTYNEVSQWKNTTEATGIALHAAMSRASKPIGHLVDEETMKGAKRFVWGGVLGHAIPVYATLPALAAAPVSAQKAACGEFIDVRKHPPKRGQRIQGLSSSGAWIETFDPDEPLGSMTHWRVAGDNETDSEPSVDETITIDYERGGKFWHRDCKKARDGIMRVVSNEETGSTIECMHCGKRGSYPVGSVGCVTVAAAPAVQSQGGDKK